MKNYKEILEKNDIKNLYKVLGSIEKNSWNSFISDLSSELLTSEKINIPTEKLDKVMKKVIKNVY